MRGIIYKSTGSWYLAKTAGGRLTSCRIKGIFKIDQEITSTNPAVVGDEVELEWDSSESDAQITEIFPRKNYIVRSSPHRKFLRHIVASNLDQGILVASLREPRTSAGFIDRFLVTANAYHIPGMLLVNKTDLLRTKEQRLLEVWKQRYQRIGYPVLLTSALEGSGLDILRRQLEGKVSLMAGHSGVGKSSLINSLIPDLGLKTQAVSGWSGKGIHTTTVAETFELPGGGRIIDTPGIREFGIVDLEPPELSHYFVEMQEFISLCAFNNCLHAEEPGCAVKQAVEEGKIDFERYASYLNILASLEKRSY